MTTDGNHERDFPGSGSLFEGTDSGGECGVAYAHRFAMPTPSAVHRSQQPKKAKTKKSNAHALLERMKHARSRHTASASAAGSGSHHPSAVSGVVHDTPWYSQNFGSVHFVLMSTEHDFSPASEQYAFLEAGKY